MHTRFLPLIALLSLAACATTATQEPAAQKPTQADSCMAFDEAMPEAKPKDPSVKRSCWGTPPKSGEQRILLPTFPSAEALKEALTKDTGGSAVTLDGDTLRLGFGPATAYRSLPDGSVSRK